MNTEDTGIMCKGTIVKESVVAVNTVVTEGTTLALVREPEVAV